MVPSGWPGTAVMAGGEGVLYFLVLRSFFFIALTLEQVHLVENENLIMLLKQRPHFLSLPSDMTLSAIKLKRATIFKIIHQKNIMGV